MAHSASTPALPAINSGDGSPSSSPKKAARMPKSNPGPGAYQWSEDVHKNRSPLWSVTAAPDRRNLGYKECSWTPTISSGQGTWPDPAHYGDISHLGPHGVHSPPKATMRGRGDDRRGMNPQRRDLFRFYDLPGSVGTSHPALARPPQWSVTGTDRTYLPHDKPTWTPQPVKEMRPGPGAYNVHRRPRWFAPNRNGCTFGRRPADLPQDIPMWVGTTYQQRFRGYG